MFPGYTVRVPSRTGERRWRVVWTLLLWHWIPIDKKRMSAVIMVAFQVQDRIIDRGMQGLVVCTPTQATTVITVIHRRDFPVVVILVVSINGYGHLCSHRRGEVRKNKKSDEYTWSKIS